MNAASPALQTTDNWHWHTATNSAVRIIEALQGPGGSIARAWDPGSNTVWLVPDHELTSLSSASPASPHAIHTIASVARINDAISRDVLLAPLDVPVIPLPHQIAALRKVTDRDPVRALLADEVGLGKTIEAGLILRELKLRGLVQRTLVVAPAGLVGQWVAELDTHFREQFELVLPSQFDDLRRTTGASDIWSHFDQVVTSMDSVKPISGRSGWSNRRVEHYNRERFASLIEAGWDLVIVDEAHRLPGASESVARYELGQGLATASRHLLLLSATPHSGKSDAFHRLMALIDERAFPTQSSVTRPRVLPYVARTEKRQALTIDGDPLFLPRTTRMEAVNWGTSHELQEDLYEAVTEYVREGYNQAVAERRNAVGFLLILYQRLVTSSTRAVRSALERRLQVLGGETATSEFAEPAGENVIGQPGDLVRRTILISASERQDVEHLLQLARTVEARGPDAKAQRLLDLIVEQERLELDPQLKVLVFTECTATQQMLAEFLSSQGYEVGILNGSMSLEERRIAQQGFAESTRILISTEAGGEGLNLQFCHVVVNYDLPWNPMRLEQRIGRVDRIGQTKPVLAINLSLEASVEHRVQEVLERKLETILKDLGVDKLSDVLDSGDVETDFDHLYVSSIMNPAAIESETDSVITTLRSRATETHRGAALIRTDEAPDPDATRGVIEHPLPAWIETLTLNAVRDQGGVCLPRLIGYDITWEDGEQWTDAVFRHSDKTTHEHSRHVSLSEPKLQRLLKRGWRHVPGQPVPRIAIPGLVSGVEGFWSLWQLRGVAGERSYDRYFPLFLHDDGRLLLPSARRLWDQVLRTDVDLVSSGVVDPDTATAAWEMLHESANKHASPLYSELKAEHRDWLENERDKLVTYYAGRRELTNRIGLESVREHRLELLGAEEERKRIDLDAATDLLCELSSMLLIHVEPGTSG